MFESKFTGGFLGSIGVWIVQFVIILITLGIGTPWAICYKENWYAEHTYIDGRQLRFDGTGGQLFGNFIIWTLLTFITCGIYGLFLPSKYKKWVISHTHNA